MIPKITSEKKLRRIFSIVALGSIFFFVLSLTNEIRAWTLLVSKEKINETDLRLPRTWAQNLDEQKRFFAHFAFTGSVLIHSKMTDDSFQDVIFLQSWILGNDFSGSKMQAVRWEKSQIWGANFRGVQFIKNVFLQSFCKDCDFRDADLSNSDFYLTDLRGSIYNAQTRLPFPETMAFQMGMRKVP